MEARATDEITSGAVTVRKVQADLEEAGIEFTSGGQTGVRLKYPPSDRRETQLVTNMEKSVMQVVSVINY